MNKSDKPVGIITGGSRGVGAATAKLLASKGWNVTITCTSSIEDANNIVKECEELDLLIYFLPPYSPELNLIEILWKRIKYQWIPFEAYVNSNTLNENLESILENVGAKYVIKF